MTDSTGLLLTLETYYDKVPPGECHRHRGRALHPVRPQRPGSLDYDARPRLGLTAAVTRGQVDAVRARQRDLGVPESIGAPDHAEPARPVRSSNLTVAQWPLLVLSEPVVAPAGALERWIC